MDDGDECVGATVLPAVLSIVHHRSMAIVLGRWWKLAVVHGTPIVKLAWLFAVVGGRSTVLEEVNVKDTIKIRYS